MVVSPEGTGSTGDRPGPGRAVLFVFALLLIVIGFVALGTLSSTNQVAAPETTTTVTTVGDVPPPLDLEHFSVSQIVTGEQLEWAPAGEFDDVVLVGLTEHDRTFYLFTAPSPGRPVAGGGLTAWRSQDGLGWTSLGQVIDDGYFISEVASTARGLVATGTPAKGQGMVVWTSDDGAHWDESDISVDTGSPYLASYPTAIAVTDDAILVSAAITLDSFELVEDHLREKGIELDLTPYSWGVDWLGEDGHVLTIRGPLGIEVLEIPLDELDLTSQEREWFVNGFRRVSATQTWVQRDGPEWRAGEIEGAHSIDSLIGLPDGSTLAFGFGAVGPLIRQSQDGLTWTSVDGGSEPDRVRPWRGGLVGVANQSRPEIVVSDDGRIWEPLGVAEHFPFLISWVATAMDAGPDGVAMAVEGGSAGPMSEPPDPPTVTAKDGSTLTLDFEQSVFLLEKGDNTYTWAMNLAAGSPNRDTGVEVDARDQIVTFLHPETGEPVAEVTFAELSRTETTYFTNSFRAREHRAFVFTPDGSKLTIQDLSSEIGPEATIGTIEIAGNRILAVIQPRPVPFGPGPLSPDGSRFEIWTAEIP